jgi:hypothetical protein
MMPPVCSGTMSGGKSDDCQYGLMFKYVMVFAANAA